MNFKEYLEESSNDDTINKLLDLGKHSGHAAIQNVAELAREEYEDFKKTNDADFTNLRKLIKFAIDSGDRDTVKLGRRADTVEKYFTNRYDYILP